MNNDKGESLSDLTSSLGLIICNQGDRPTWQRNDSKSYIDVTITSANLAARVKHWQVSEEYSHSDHSYIEYDIEDVDPRSRIEFTTRNLKNIDKKKLEETIIEKTKNIDTGNTANDSAKVLNRALTEILDRIAPKKKICTSRRSVYWWTPQTNKLRETSNYLRRVYTRKRRRTVGDACVIEKEALRQAKLELTKAIKKAKEDS